MKSQALVKTANIVWARSQARLSRFELAKKLSVKEDRIEEWEKGESFPTFKQAQKLADSTHIPFGYLYLSNLPNQDINIPDLRTMAGKRILEPSRELKDVISKVELQQEWYRDYLLSTGAQELSFVDSFSVKDRVLSVVEDMRKNIGVKSSNALSWDCYERQLTKNIESIGVLVMRSGVVGNNTHRVLDPEEFRGFAISDKIAPVIFINGADAATALLFTLIHELAHIWIGSSGVSNLEDDSSEEEKFCNSVAGEFLVPHQDFIERWKASPNNDEKIKELARYYKVSTMVIMIRAYHCKLINWQQYSDYRALEKQKAKSKVKNTNGGDFYKTSKIKNGLVFSSTVISEALSGRMLLRDAGKLLDIKPASFKLFARELE